ncbi:MAG: hypothetical protein AB7T32_08735 [Dehalococcoidia bacterium]
MKRITVLGIPLIAVVAMTASLTFGRGDEKTPNQASTPAGEHDEHGRLEGDAASPDPRAQGVIVVAGEDGMLRFRPDGTSLGRVTEGYANPGLSFDGAWQAWSDCGSGGVNATCRLAVTGAGVANTFDTGAAAVRLQAPSANTALWAHAESLLAALDVEKTLYVIEAASRTPTVIATGVSAFAWTADDSLLFAADTPEGPGLQRYTRGRITTLAALDTPVTRFYQAPDGMTVAFAQEHTDGWRLLSVDAATGALTDYGHIGAVPERNAVHTSAPQFAISWSQDQKYLAVSAVGSPFLLQVFEIGGNQVVRHFFDEGYAGELVWSPDNRQLAISTYSPDRSRHEVYVLDASASGGDVRHLLKGCRVVWSPDGLFLALKREPHTEGAGIVEVATGVHWQLAGSRVLTPVAWGADDASAVRRALEPMPGSSVLGK